MKSNEGRKIDREIVAMTREIKKKEADNVNTTQIIQRRVSILSISFRSEILIVMQRKHNFWWS